MCSQERRVLLQQQKQHQQRTDSKQQKAINVQNTAALPQPGQQVMCIELPKLTSLCNMQVTTGKTLI